MFNQEQKNLILEFASIVSAFEKAKDKLSCAINDELKTKFWGESLLFWADELTKIQEKTGIQYWSQERIESWKDIVESEFNRLKIAA